MADTVPTSQAVFGNRCHPRGATVATIVLLLSVLAHPSHGLGGYPSNTSTLTTTATVSPPPTDTASPTPSSSSSTTQSRSASNSRSASYTVSVTPSVTGIPTPSATYSKTVSTSPSHSSSKSASAGTSSFSSTLSVSPSASASSSKTVSVSVTPGPTVTNSLTESKSLSVSQSISPTWTPPPTPTVSLSLTVSVSPSDSPSVSASRTASITTSPSTTRSLTISIGTPTPSSEETQSLELTPSDSISPSSSGPSISESGATESEPMTTSAIPPTTSPLPTPSQTIPTGCPDCQNGTCGYTEIEGQDSTLRIPFCQCYSDFSRGFWVGGRVLGEACTECQPYVWGDGCLRICPGGLCSPCSAHGYCDDGLLGTGKCSCFNGTEGRGVWDGDDCSECAPGWFNDTCVGECQCSVHGACRAGRTGNGTCVCDPEWDGARCDRCAFGYYGANCSACLPSPENPCNGHGTCQGSTGECVCDKYFSGSLCDVPCPNCNCVGGPCQDCPGNCSSVGTCVGQFGTCDCPTDRRGADCSFVCPTNGAGHICSGHGVCGANGACTCFSNSSVGFYSGTRCDVCQPAYNSTGCNISCPERLGCEPHYAQCPTNLPNGYEYRNFPCGNEGTCWNGVCSCNTVPVVKCGTRCELSAGCGTECADPNRYGRSCEFQCQCERGTCDSGRLGTGRCTCPSGFTGTQCEIACDGQVPDPANAGQVLPCSGNGSCVPGVGTCSCNEGFAGQNCTQSCIRSPGGVLCHGHGECDDGVAGSGLCRCNGSYVGPTTGCAHVCDCVSSAAGSCNDAGVCQCNTFFTGTGCADCTDGLSGPTCTVRCSRTYGVTTGTTCVCAAGRGSAGCERACGRGPDGDLCSGHGTCGYGDTNTGMCRCDSSPAVYLGPSCNCTDDYCRSERSNSRCDASTGQCICTTRFGGTRCDDCSRATWGKDCSEVCGCGDHGYCTRLTGQCVCDADAQRGFWSGSLCQDCAEGYFGSDCTQRSVYSTQLPSYTISVPPSRENFFAPLRSTILLYTRGTSAVTSRHLSADPSAEQTVTNNGTLWTAGTLVTQLVDSNQRVPSKRFSIAAAGFVECGNAPIAMWYSRGRVFYISGCNIRTEFHDLVIIGSQVASLPIVSGPSNRTEVIASYEPGAQRLVSHVTFFNRNVSGSVPFVPGRSIIATDDVLAEHGVPTLCVFNAITRGLVNQYFDVTCRHNFTAENGFSYGSASNQLPFTMADVAAVAYVPYPQDKLIMLGVDDLSTCVGYEYGVSTLGIPKNAPVFEAMNNINAGSSAKCTSVKGAAIAGSWLVIVIQRAGQPRVLRTAVDGPRVNHQWTSPLSEAPAFGHDAVAIAVDRPSSVVYIIINQASTAYFVKVLCTDDRFEVLGSQALDTTTSEDRRASNVALSEDSRIVNVLQAKAQGVAVRRFITYDVTEVVPPFADRRGGTRLTIVGRGFANNEASGERAKARIGDAVVDGTVMSTTEMHVTAPTTEAGECEQDAVAVSMSGDIYTINKVFLERYEQPSVSAASPATQHYKSPVSVTVTGQGFFVSDYIMCRYATTIVTPAPYVAPNGVVLYRSKSRSATHSSTPASVSRSLTLSRGTFSRSGSSSRSFVSMSRTPTMPLPTNAPLTPAPNPYHWREEGTMRFLEVRGQFNASADTILCPGLSGVDSAWRGLLDVALDGSVYSGTPQTIVLVGTARGFVLSYTTVTLTADSSVTFPPLDVNFVDAAGNLVGDTFDTSVYVTATLGPDQGAAVAGEAPLALSPSSTTLEALAGSPRVTFANLVMRSPRSTLAVLVVTARYIHSAAPLRWEATCAVSVTQGPLHSIVVVQQPSATVDVGGRLAKKPIVDLLDVAGNRLGSESTGTLARAHVIESLAAAAPAALLKQIGEGEATNNFTATCLSGTCSFDDPIDRINARGGFSYKFYLWVEGAERETIASAVSDEMLPSCSPGTYRQLGRYDCTVCVEHGTCNGGARNELVLQPGYWRSSPYSWEIYQCNPPFACPGGNLSGAAVCAAGYSGPRCGECEDGFAKSIGGNCVECYDKETRMGLFVFILFAAFGLLIAMIVLSAQNWRISSGAVVVLQLLVTHMQVAVSVGELETAYPDFFEETVSWVSVIADLRVLDISFADCVLRGDGSNFLAKFAVFALSPVLAMIAAGIAWVILFINPEALRLAVSKGGAALSEMQIQYARSMLILRRKKLAAEAKRFNRDPRDYIRSQEGSAFSYDEVELLPNGEEDDAAKQGSRLDKVLRRSDFTFLATTALQVVLFFMYPTAVAYSLEMLFCTSVNLADGSTVSLLTADMSIDCTDPTYLIFRRVAIAATVLLILGAPLGFIVGFFCHLRLRSERRLERKQLFSFLLQGLKPRQWYFPALVFLRKGLFKVIVVTLPAPADSWCALWLNLLYVPVLLYLTPYENKLHMYLDALSAASDVVAINASFALLVAEPYYVRVIIASLSMLVLVTVGFVCLWVSSEYPRFALKRWYREKVLKVPVTTYNELENEDRATGLDLSQAKDRRGNAGRRITAPAGFYGDEDEDEAAAQEQQAWVAESLRQQGYGEADALQRLIREREEEEELREQRNKAAARRLAAVGRSSSEASRPSEPASGSFAELLGPSPARSVHRSDGDRFDVRELPEEDDDDAFRDFDALGDGGQRLLSAGNDEGDYRPPDPPAVTSVARPFRPGRPEEPPKLAVSQHGRAAGFDAGVGFGDSRARAEQRARQEAARRKEEARAAAVLANFTSVAGGADAQPASHEAGPSRGGHRPATDYAML